LVEVSTVSETDEKDQSEWGVRFTRLWQGVEDWLEWVNRLQREQWGKPGLVLWDHCSQQVTHLSATLAMQLLDYLRTTDDWKHTETVVGKPATRLFPYDPERTPEEVITDQMTLTPVQSQEILDQLKGNEEELRRMCEAEREERRQALHKVYSYLLELAHKREVQQAGDPGSGMEDS
jgi:hypothetical protein